MAGKVEVSVSQRMIASTLLQRRWMNNKAINKGARITAAGVPIIENVSFQAAPWILATMVYSVITCPSHGQGTRFDSGWSHSFALLSLPHCSKACALPCHALGAAQGASSARLAMASPSGGAISPEEALAADEMIQWCLASGTVMKRRSGGEAGDVIHAPFALHPLALPRRLYDRMLRAQPLFNVLVHEMTREAEWLDGICKR